MFFKSFFLLLLLVSIKLKNVACSSKTNILIFIADDLGWADVGMNGNKTIQTPNIDKIASEGVRLSHHLSAAPVCTPSRAALLTGRYPVRYGMASPNRVQVIITLGSTSGLPQNETTFAEVAQQNGYNTALVGKWHLGLHCGEYGNGADFCHHPNKQGFDYFYGVLLTMIKDFSPFQEGVLLSNVGWKKPYHVIAGCLLSWIGLLFVLRKMKILTNWIWILMLLFFGLFMALFVYAILFQFLYLVNSMLHRNMEVVEQPLTFQNLTQKLVYEGSNYLEQRAADKKPFLLMMSWLQTHTPLYNSVPGFRGRSRHGFYGDNIEEMDWSVGEILRTLDQLELSQNTLVYFTSDNGGHIEERIPSGEPGGGWNEPFRGGKCQASVDGGIRVAGAIRWPGHIKPGSEISSPTSHLDMMPTLATVMGAKIPQDRVIDGRDLNAIFSELTLNRSIISPHQYLYSYCGTLLHAVRYVDQGENGNKGRVYKLRYYSPKWVGNHEGCRYLCGCFDNMGSEKHSSPRLFDLTADQRETVELQPESEVYGRLVPQIQAATITHQREVADTKGPETLNWAQMLPRPWLVPCCSGSWLNGCYCQDSKFNQPMPSVDLQ